MDDEKTTRYPVISSIVGHSRGFLCGVRGVGKETLTSGGDGGERFNLFSCTLRRERGSDPLSMSEFIVDPHPDNVLGRIDVGHIRICGGSRLLSDTSIGRRAEVHIEVFELDAAIVGERVFAAGADRPSGLKS